MRSSIPALLFVLLPPLLRFYSVKTMETVTRNLPSERKIKNLGRGVEELQNKKKGNNSRRRRSTCRVQAREPIRSGCFSAAFVLLVSASIRLIMAMLKRTAAAWSCDILERGPTGPIKSGGWEEKHSFPLLFFPLLFLFFLSRCDGSVMVLFHPLHPLHSHNS